MNKNEITYKLSCIIINIYPKLAGVRITLESNLKDDLGIDSVGIVEVVMDIEDGFGIDTDTSKSYNCKTFGDVVNLIESYLN